MLSFSSIGLAHRTAGAVTRATQWPQYAQCASTLAPTPPSRASRRSASPDAKGAPISTVERGTRYEEHVMAYLHSALSGTRLARVGGASDGGIDLSGWWWLRAESRDGPESDGEMSCLPATLPDRVRVMVQCKAEAKKLGPIHIREIQGAYASRYGMPQASPSELDDEGAETGELAHQSVSPTSATMRSNIAAVGILASCSGFSKQCIMQAMACPIPLILVYLVHPFDVDGITKASDSSTASRSASPESDSPVEAFSLLINDALQRDLFAHALSVRWITRPPARRRESNSPSSQAHTPQMIPRLVLSTDS